MCPLIFYTKTMTTQGTISMHWCAHLECVTAGVIARGHSIRTSIHTSYSSRQSLSMKKKNLYILAKSKRWLPPDRFLGIIIIKAPVGAKRAEERRLRQQIYSQTMQDLSNENSQKSRKPHTKEKEDSNPKLKQPHPNPSKEEEKR